MAFETERANIIMPTDVVSGDIAQALVKNVVFTPLIRGEGVPADTPVKKFVKDDELVGSELAESTALTFSADHEVVQTAVSSTATKFVSGIKVTVETQRFTRMTTAERNAKLGRAIARDLEDEALALTSGFSNQQIATAGATKNDLLTAASTVRANTLNVTGNMLVGVISEQQKLDLQIELTDTAATAFSNPFLLSLLSGSNPTNGLVGEFAGVVLYRQFGLPTTGGDDIGLVYDPELALRQQSESTVNVWESNKGSEGFYTEAVAWTFYDVVELYDEAGVGFRSNS